MRVRVYVLGGAVAEVILLGSLVLTAGEVVIEAETPGHVGDLENILNAPIRVWVEWEGHVWY